jgi:DNA-binding SARP family transcriptional activator
VSGLCPRARDTGEWRNLYNPVVLRVELLGGFRVLTNGRPAARLPGGRQQQLIALLILQARGAPVARLRCAASLWPDSTDSQALTNLRRELHHLREGWPELEGLIVAGSRTLAWSADSGAIADVIAFEAAADRGLAGDGTALVEAARLYKGDLLPDSSAEWVEGDRERLRERARKVLARLVSHLEHDGAFEEAIQHVQQLIRLDPLDEDAWCAAMRCHARRGARAAALHLYHECAALLKKELGISPSGATRMTYREILDCDEAEPGVATAPPRTTVYPLIGRGTEWQTLLRAWRAAGTDRNRLVLIRGESGIGKTRLAEELVDWCGTNVTALTSRCYAGEGGLAYAPIAAWLGNDALRSTLAQLDPSTLSDLARLRPEVIAAHPDVLPPDGQLESWQRLRFFESLVRAFRSAAPVVLVLDDLQWADADTIDWLCYFVRSSSNTRCLVLATARAEEEQDNPALGRLLGNLEGDDRLTVIALDRLDRVATGELAGAVSGHTLDEEALARAFHETEGHPLFIVERGRMDQAREPGATGTTSAPSRVHAVVTARLGLLSKEARAAADVAAVLGRDFPFDILSRASDLDENVLVRALDELWRRNIVRVQAGERWDFAHDRFREIAYAAIGPARARLIHRRIADAMEHLFAHRLDEVSGTIALHLDRGGQPDRAVLFLERAAEVATRISANEEAIRCLTYALSLLERLPAGRERDERELSLRSHLTVALNAGRGYTAPEVEQNLDRILVLNRAGDREVPIRWLWVAFTLRYVLGELKRARVIAEEILARSTIDLSYRCEAHHSMAAWLLSAGELERSRAHFEASLAAYDERTGRRSPLGSDLGVFVHAWCAHPLWLLGEEAAALAHAEQAITLARRFDHPFSLTLALAYAALLHQMRHDTAALVQSADAVVGLCDKYGFAFYRDWAIVLLGWVRGQEQPAEGVEIIESALARLDADRAQARRPYYISLLAETCERAGNRDRAATLVDAAIAMALERPDVWWLPALYLQKSGLVASPQRGAALRTALDLARAQGSRTLERRILASSGSIPGPNAPRTLSERPVS